MEQAQNDQENHANENESQKPSSNPLMRKMQSGMRPAIGGALGILTQARNKGLLRMQTEINLNLIEEQEKETLEKQGVIELHGKKFNVSNNSLFFLSREHKIRWYIRWFIEWKYFDYFIMFTILFNSIALAIYDYSDRNSTTVFNQTIDTINYAFNAIYISEAALKILGMGFVLHEYSYLRYGWNVLDLIVVISAILEMIPQFSMFKQIKSIRAIRPLRSINAIEEMKAQVNVLIISVPNLLHISALLFSVITIFAIVGIQQFNGAYYNRCRLTPEPLNSTYWPADMTFERLCDLSDPTSCYGSEYGRYCGNGQTQYGIDPSFENVTNLEFISYGVVSFDNMGRAILSVLLAILLFGWSQMMYDFMDSISSIFAALYYCILVLFGSYFLLNFVLAVIVDAYHKIEQSELKKANANKVLEAEKRTRRFEAIKNVFRMMRLTEKKMELYEAGGMVYKQTFFDVVFKIMLKKLYEKKKDQHDMNNMSFKSKNTNPIAAITNQENNIQQQSLITQQAIDNVTTTDQQNKSLFSNFSSNITPGFKKKSSIFVAPTKNLFFRQKAMDNEKDNISKQNNASVLDDKTKSIKKQTTVNANTSMHDGIDMHEGSIKQKSKLYQHFNLFSRYYTSYADSLFLQSAHQHRNPLGISEIITNDDDNLSSRRGQSGRDQEEDSRLNGSGMELNHVITIKGRVGSPKIRKHLTGQIKKVTSIVADESAVDIEKNNDYEQNQEGDNDIQKQESLKLELHQVESQEPNLLDNGEREKFRIIVDKSQTHRAAAEPSQFPNTMNESSMEIDIKESHFQEWCLYIIESKTFFNVYTVLILTNVVIICCDRFPISQYETNIYNIMNYIYYALFDIEMVLKMIGLGMKQYFQNGFNILDFIIVVLNSVEIILEQLFSQSVVVKVFKSMRILRLMKVVKAWKQLQDLMHVILKILKDMKNFAILLFICVFTFTLLGLQFFGYLIKFDENDNYDLDAGTSPENNFDGFVRAFTSIFIVLSGEQWNVLMFDAARAISVYTVLFFVSIVILGQIILLNLFLAILIENFEKARRAIEEGGDDVIGDFEWYEKLKEFLTQKYNKIKYGICIRKTAKYSMSIEDSSIVGDESKQNIPKRRMSAFSSSPECPTPGNNRSPELNDAPSDNHDNMTSNIQGKSLNTQEEQKEKEEQEKQEKKRLKNMKRSQSRLHRQLSIDTLAILNLKGRSLFIFSQKNLLRVVLSKILASYIFEGIMLFFILGSSILLAIENPLDNPVSNEQNIIYYLEVTVAAVFILEVVIKVINFGLIFNGPTSYMRNLWNLFDLTVITLSIVPIVYRNQQNNLFRLIKLMRVLRPLRVINKNEGLKIAVKTIIKAFPKIINVFMISSIFFILFGSICTTFFKGQFYYCDTTSVDVNFIASVITRADCINYGGVWTNTINNFDNIGNSVLLIFIMGMTGWIDVMWLAVDSAGNNLQPIDTGYQVSWCVFFIFIKIILQFFIMNLFAGVIVSAYNREKEASGGTFLLTHAQKGWLKMKLFVLHTKPYIIKQLDSASRLRTFCFKLCMNKGFEYFILGCIIANTILLASVSNYTPTIMSYTLDQFNLIFASIFALEMIIKIIAYEKKYFDESWNIFDFGIVILSWAAIAMNYTISSKYSASATIVRTFRVARVLRLIRKAKFLRFIMNTFIITLPSIANIGGLLLLIIYIYAVAGIFLFAKLKQQTYLNDWTNFQDFSHSFITLIRASAGESWELVAYDMMMPQSLLNNCIYNSQYSDISANFGLPCECGTPWALVYLISFQLLVQFIFLKLFIAIILHGFDEMNKKEDDVLCDANVEKFRETWSKFDAYGTGFIQIYDFVEFLQVIGWPLGFSEKWEGNVEQKEQEFLKSIQLPTYNQYRNYQYYDVMQTLAERVYLENEAKQQLQGKLLKDQNNPDGYNESIIEGIKQQLNLKDKALKQKNIEIVNDAKELEHEIYRELKKLRDVDMDSQHMWVGGFIKKNYKNTEMEMKGKNFLIKTGKPLNKANYVRPEIPLDNKLSHLQFKRTREILLTSQSAEVDGTEMDAIREIEESCDDEGEESKIYNNINSDQNDAVEEEMILVNPYQDQSILNDSQQVLIMPKEEEFAAPILPKVIEVPQVPMLRQHSTIKEEEEEDEDETQQRTKLNKNNITASEPQIANSVTQLAIQKEASIAKLVMNESSPILDLDLLTPQQPPQQVFKGYQNQEIEGEWMKKQHHSKISNQPRQRSIRKDNHRSVLPVQNLRKNSNPSPIDVQQNLAFPVMTPQGEEHEDHKSSAVTTPNIQKQLQEQLQAEQQVDSLEEEYKRLIQTINNRIPIELQFKVKQRSVHNQSVDKDAILSGNSQKTIRILNSDTQLDETFNWQKSVELQQNISQSKSD